MPKRYTKSWSEKQSHFQRNIRIYIDVCTWIVKLLQCMWGDNDLTLLGSNIFIVMALKILFFNLVLKFFLEGNKTLSRIYNHTWISSADKSRPYVRCNCTEITF